jgi:hypothetical protein
MIYLYASKRRTERMRARNKKPFSACFAKTTEEIRGSRDHAYSMKMAHFALKTGSIQL